MNSPEGLAVRVPGPAVPPDPRSAAGGKGMLGASLVWRPLVATDGLPGLAAAVEYTALDTRARCTLRPDAAFRGGAAVTAEDVVASCADTRDVHGLTATATGPRTVEISGVHGGTLGNALGTLLVRSARAPETGSGPYRIGVADPDAGVVLLRDDDWWGARPGLPARIELLAIDDPHEASALQRDGRLDIVTEAAEGIAAGSLADASVEVYRGAAADLQLLMINTRRPPFTRNAVRTALAAAVDRAALTAALGGFASPAASLVAGCRGRAADEQRESLTGIAATIHYNRENPTRARLAALLAGDLAAAGMLVGTCAVPWAELVRRTVSGDFDLLLSTVAADSTAAQRALWHSGGRTPGDNPTGLADPAVDRALDTAAGDARARGALAAELDRAQPAVPLTLHPEHLVTAVPGAPLALLFGRTLTRVHTAAHAAALTVEGDVACC